MTVSPIVSAAAIPIGRLWRRWSRQDQPVTSIEIPKESLDAHVILGGYGRSGRAVARILRDAEIPLVVVETNYSLYADLKSEGLAGIWGDVASVEILDAAGVRRARLFLLTMPEATTVQISAQRARQANPGIEVIARAAREHHVVELKRAGVQCAVLPEFEGGLEMARQALARYPYEEGKTRALVENLRRELYGKAGAGTGA
jgi:CPA2 family monovalent cation:H+ antiporter-2